MTVTFQLPNDLEQDLRQSVEDINTAAKEAFLVSLYREAKLTHVALSQALSLDRIQTEELLHKHHVTEDLGTLPDYLADVAMLENLGAKLPK